VPRVHDAESPGGLDDRELTGRARTHVVDVTDPACTLHPAALAALLEMRAAAAAEGLELAVASSFRDFDRQLAIWNAKYRGERILLDRGGAPVARGAVAGPALIDTILLWSALPGASRHHWGSDLDLIDRAAMPPGYRAQLVPGEFAAGGVFERLDRWLTANMAGFGFFRPYATDRGGVRPEPWHLSFAPVSEPALAALSPAVLRSAIEGSSIEGLSLVLGRLPELHGRYVAAVDPAPAAALASASARLRSSTRPS